MLYAWGVLRRGSWRLSALKRNKGKVHELRYLMFYAVSSAATTWAGMHAVRRLYQSIHLLRAS